MHKQALALAAAGALLAGPAEAKSNLLFILDVSNSMWGQVDGVAKIETAKQALGGLVSDLPADTAVGLMVYGDTSQSDCKDVRLLSGIGADTPAALVGKIEALQPKGKTPIAYALEQSAEAFAGREEEDGNAVVLVSDGIESCGGDPCAAAGALAARNVDLKVHVIGFDIDAEAKAQMECIAANGGGRYFDAKSTEDFKLAVAEARQVVQADPAPAPAPEKTLTEVFRDDFDGADLAEHWEVINPNPDAFIVEEGELLMVSGAKGDFPDDTVQNLFRLTETLPEGDWTATMQVRLEPQTTAERLTLMLYDDKDRWISAELRSFVSGYANLPGGNRNEGIYVGAAKLAGSELAEFQLPFFDCGRCYDSPSFSSHMKQTLTQPILLRLRKQGRSFIASARYEGWEDKARWLELEKLTTLRAKGSLAIGFTQNPKGFKGGESLAHIDWVKIEAPQ